MTRAALSVFMYGLYLVLSVAVSFLMFPHFALELFGLSAGDELWVRFTGLFAGVIGGFYIAAVMSRFNPMLGWSVLARYASATFMAAMVATGTAGLGLLIFAALDALTASITWVAIRTDAEEKAAA